MANKEGLSASMVRRLRAGGLDAKDQAALFTRLKGMKSVHEIAKDWGNWSSDEKRLMALFVQRNAKRTLGEGGVGDTVQLMHSATGRIFTQFRTFMTNSYSAVLLHGLHMRDWQTAQMWMGSTLFAGIGMAARNYINTIGIGYIALEKGYSQVDWLKLSRTHPDLNGLGGAALRKNITMGEVAQHSSAEDGWMVLKGKVYNVGPYARFHPGGGPRS
ncbi:MAG: hypothetical protein WDW36_003877 [Sanguina aurantia]